MTNIRLDKQVNFKRCPHCSIANPNITFIQQFQTTNANGNNKRTWKSYSCRSCGGAIIGSHGQTNIIAQEIFPSSKVIDQSVPQKAAEFLKQSLETLHAPAGSIMLSASAIDAMLKEKGYTEGSLYNRIDKASVDHLITQGMSKWAHQIRIEANDQRHADKEVNLPTEEDAKRVNEFAIALAEFLFVLPSKVQEAIEKTK